MSVHPPHPIHIVCNDVVQDGTTALQAFTSQAVSVNATAGEGGDMELVGAAPRFYAGIRQGTPNAVLSAGAAPMHIEEYLVLRQGLVPGPDNTFVPGLVWVSESKWVIGESPTDDYYSRNVIIRNSAKIESSHFSLPPILAHGSLGSVTVINSGELKFQAGGDVRDVGIAGIRAISGVGSGVAERIYEWEAMPSDWAHPGGQVTIDNSGKISTDFVFSDNTTGIHGSSLGGGVAITNSGEIQMRDDNSRGISADAIRPSLVAINNSAPILMAGTGSTAITASILEGGTIRIVNSNTLSLIGDNVTGISVTNGEAEESPSRDGAVTSISGNGTIEAEHDDYDGVTGIEVSAPGSTVIDYSGAIDIGGKFATGISASTDHGTIDVKVGNLVRADGVSGMGIIVSGIDSTLPGTNIAKNAGRLAVEIGPGGSVYGGSPNTPGNALERVTAGVVFVGGAENVLTNYGLITASSGKAVVAFEGLMTVDDDDPQDIQFMGGPLSVVNAGRILGDIITGSGNDSVTNQGLGVITGNIDLGGGTNSLLNRDDAVINSFDRIAVGADNTFTNSGILNPGGVGTIQSTTIIGNFVQTAGGRLLVDIREAGRASDFLSVTGSASLGGSVIPHFLAAPIEVASEYRIISAAGGVTTTGIAADPNRQVGDSVGYDFGLAFRGGNDVYLTATKRAPLDELAEDAASAAGAGGAQGQNMASVGGAVAAAEQQGGSGLGAVITALRLSPNLETMAQTMNRLIPQNQGAQTSNTSSAGASFGNAMLSCTEREGPNAYTREGQCYWAKVTARRQDRDATNGGPGVAETATEISGGVQVKLWDQLRLGLALGWEDLQSSTFDQTQRLGEGDGGRFQAGLVLKNQWGPINAYLNVAGSWANYDLDRYVGLPGIGTVAEADQNVTSLITRLRLSYLMDGGAWYVKPLVDVAATHIRLGGYTESGAGAANLNVAATDDWIFAVTPAVEAGLQLGTGDGTIFRPYARAGVTFLDTDEVSVQTSFAAAPGVPFTVRGRIEDIYADVEAGLHVLTTSGINMRLNYEGRFGEDSRQHAGSVKLSAPW